MAVVAPKTRTKGTDGPIESVYPLSPMQQGMLFNTLYDPHKGVDFEQLVITLREKVEAPLLRDAWQRVSDRHAVLRTSFLLDESQPLQQVRAAAPLPWHEHDLRRLSQEEQEERLERFLSEDRRRGFDLSAAPLMRLNLFRMGEADYRMVWSFHHAILDGRSIVLVVREVFACCEALRQGRNLKLNEPQPFADFIDWLEGQDFAEAEAYWSSTLAGLDTPTYLASSLAKEDRGELSDYGVLYHSMPRELTEGILALASSHGITANTIVQGAWALLLSRYTGKDDVVFGVTRACRKSPLGNAESMVGLLINTLPLRVKIPGDSSVFPWLQDVRAANLEVRPYELTPLSLIQRCCSLDASAPLFDSLVVFENFSLDSVLRAEGPDWKSRQFDLREKTNFPITLNAYLESELLLKIGYYRDQISDRFAKAVPGQLQTLLEAIVADPCRRVDSLPLLTEPELAQLLVGWNGTQSDHPRDGCMHTLFEQQAARTPNATAVVFQDQSLTYSELNARANQLAHYLRKQRVGPETLVGLCVNRSLEMVVGVLGILKAGGAYVPMDPAYPSDRLTYMLSESHAPLLLTQQGLVDCLSQTSARMVYLDEEGLFSQESSANPTTSVSPSNLGYVIYTSGSTGRPKGVALTHGSAAALLYWAQGVYSAQELAGVLGSTSICFDLSVFELFLPLSVGGSVILAQNALELPTLPARERVTLVNTVPSAISELQRVGGIPGSVRTINLAGEPLTSELADRLYGTGVDKVYDLYGPSEDTTYSTWSLRKLGGPATIGRPIANTRAYLLDRRMRPVPLGVAGELYLGGEGLARGYFGRSDATAEKFVPDPFSSEPGGRLYRTGDLARYFANGDIEFLGRIDHQVKVRGFRIELGEIESVLKSHAGVKECVVVAREDVPGEKRLVGYVVGTGSEELTAGVLRDHICVKLPEYMSPSAFVFLEALPLNPNGKLDRKALPAPGEADLFRRDAYLAPRTPREHTLAEIWRAVLRVEQIGVTDSFFDLGGHSLLATQIVTRVRNALGADLSVRVLFEAPTIEKLAIRVASATGGLMHEAPLAARASRDNTPLSFSQQSLWIIDQLEPDSPVYISLFALRLNGHLDTAALGKSIDEIVRRHEVLRTVFTTVEGKPVQMIRDAASTPLPLTDLREHPAATREREALRLAEQEGQKPFDLVRGPLFRARLLRLGDDEHILLLTFYHAIVDGWSFGVFMRELEVLYGGYLAGKDSSLPKLAIQYADYAVWQRERLSGETLERLVSYWKKHLDGAPAVLELPADRTRPAKQTFRGSQKHFELSTTLTQALKELSRHEGATLFMTLLAAFYALIGRYSGQEDIVVGTPSAGRIREEVEPLIGYFVNTLALRADLSGDPKFTELLARVREMALGAFAHQDLPFEKLVEELQPERSLSHSPVFQVMFNLQKAVGDSAKLDGIAIEPVRTVGTTAKFDLLLDLGETTDKLLGVLEYSTDLFDSDRMERLLGHFETLLAGIVSDPDAKISRLPFLTEPERHQLLVDWNETKTDYPRDRCIHNLFEEQATRTPNATAVVFQDRSLTYSELNARANQLAHYLRKQGVGRETLVGLCLERSVEMVVGILGILKAGGAYLPLDPSHPADRLGFMLIDGGAALLVSERSSLSALADETCPVVWLDADGEAIAAESAANLVTVSDAEDLIYVMYTSGSTGIPKGIEIPHRAVSRLLCNTDYVSLGTDRTMAQVANVAFDASTWEIWGALLFGAKLVILARDEALPSEALRDKLRDGQVRELFLTTALFNQIAEHAPEAFDGLEDLLFGGERADTLRVRALVARRRKVGLGPKRLLHVYGPTESTTYASWYEVDRIDDSENTVPIGRPLANTTIYLLDQHLQPVPIGAAGELHIGGDGLARGYLKRPDLTAEKFIPNPFGNEAGGRLYRTGDLARYRSDGSIEFVGRTDHQVKMRGFRIELGEIESVVLAHPNVKEAVILAREDSPGEKRLAGYVVCDDEELSVSSLRDYIGSKLPEYMVPWTFVFLESLPLTPNGKVDRKALPQPMAAHSFDAGYVAPRSPIEEGLAEIWREVLGVGKVGTHDSFFDLGGHSILATQVISRVRDAFQVELPLRTIFEAPTIADLAPRIVAGLGEEAGDAPVLARVAKQGPLPLSFAQQRLWYIYRLDPENPAYNVPLLFTIDGPICHAAIDQAINKLIERHEILRTAYLEEDGEARQIVLPAAEVPLEMIDLSEAPLEQREQRATDFVVEKARAPFDLGTGPAVRATLFKLDEQKHLLLLTTHHITSDGWSQAVIVKELSTLYAAALEQRSDPLPELAMQYADYAAWQRDWMGTDGMRRQIAYWQEQLEGAPVAIELPFDRLRPAVQSLRGTSLDAKLDQATTDALQSFCRQEKITLFMLLLACFKALLYCYGAGEDIVVGTDSAGRNHSELEGLVGFFVNHLVLRTDLADNPTFKELVSRVRRVALDAYAHQDVPFDRLVEVIRPERNPAYAPVFQVLFVMQNPPAPATDQGGIALGAKDAYIHTSKYDLEFFFKKVEVDGTSSIELLWVYNTDVFEANTVRRMAKQFEDLVSLIVAGSDLSLSKIKDELAAADQARRKTEQNLKDAAQRARFQSFKPKAAAITSLPSEEDR